MAEIKRLPVSQAERKIIYERKAHKAALDIRNASNKKQAISTFLRYLRRSI